MRWAEADKLDAAYKRSGLVGPLHGVTVLVKDEVDTAGMPTTLGTPGVQGLPAAARCLRDREAA